MAAAAATPVVIKAKNVSKQLDFPFSQLHAPTPSKADSSIFICQYTLQPTKHVAFLPRRLVSAVPSKSEARVGCFYNYQVLLSWLYGYQSKIDKKLFSDICTFINLRVNKDEKDFVLPARDRKELKLFGGVLSFDDWIRDSETADKACLFSADQYALENSERQQKKPSREDSLSFNSVFTAETTPAQMQHLDVYVWPEMKAYAIKRLDCQPGQLVGALSQRLGLEVNQVPMVEHKSDEWSLHLPASLTKRQTTRVRKLRGEDVKAKRDKKELDDKKKDLKRGYEKQLAKGKRQRKEMADELTKAVEEALRENDSD
jgi:hypothetical protein